MARLARYFLIAEMHAARREPFERIAVPVLEDQPGTRYVVEGVTGQHRDGRRVILMHSISLAE